MEKKLTRAEERGYEALPPRWRKSKDGSTMIDSRLPVRKFYIRAYEQAEKDLGWVSVKDKLPEEGHFVLTCVADTGTPQCVGMALLLKDGTWWDGDIKVCVDYWMEVPKIMEK